MSNLKSQIPLINSNSNVPIKDFAGPVIQTGSIKQTDFVSTPLPPEWILEGNPAARSVPLARAEDGNLSCGLWDCQAGKFKFIFATDEIIQILEGEVIIEEKGKTHSLGVGDVAFFPEGLVAYWTVPNYVKKYAIFRSVSDPLSTKIYRRLKKILRGLLGK
ncbi:MAG: DUF861 domain-containing protein [Anaerolineae bacterium]|nr:DUF861 domain-containing protein [Anaerolineae bacterium]